MEDKIFVSDNKILEHNEKAFYDTIQLFEKVNSDSIHHDVLLVKDNPNMLSVLPSLYLDKGRTIWIELKVEDSYMSGMIMRWLFSKSNFDNRNGLHALGCSMQQIMYEKPSGYSQDEKQAILKLYEAAFGNN